MTLGGWLLMIIAVGGITGFLTWCVYRIVATPGATEHVHSQADIELPDVDRD